MLCWSEVQTCIRPADATAINLLKWSPGFRKRAIKRVCVVSDTNYSERACLSSLLETEHKVLICTCATITVFHKLNAAYHWNKPDIEPGQRVIFHVRVIMVWDQSFSDLKKKPKTKIYIFPKICPTVIEILTFNRRFSKFYFPEAYKRQTAIKTGKPLAHCKRLSAT